MFQRQGTAQAVGIGVVGLDDDNLMGAIYDLFNLVGFGVHTMLIIVAVYRSQPKGLNGLAAFQGPAEGNLVGVFQVDTDRQAARQPGNLDIPLAKLLLDIQGG